MGAARAIRSTDTTAIADLVVVGSKPARAHELHLAGASWHAIATELHYASAKVAQMAVHAYLEKSAVDQGLERRREAFALELARLDKLQAAVWDYALNGDLRAIVVVLKISAQRTALWGFGGRDNTMTEQPRTVVIVDGDGPEYIAKLKLLIAQQESETVR